MSDESVAVAPEKKVAKKKVAPKAAKPTKKAAKKAPKKAVKGTKTASKAAPKSGITGRESTILTTLAKNSKPLTRKQLVEKTGIKAGWSKLLGAPTKGVAPESLEGRGLVKSESQEGVTGVMYSITAAGRKAIGK
jgi:endonuclease YncB( thermonuclease family)